MSGLRGVYARGGLPSLSVCLVCLFVFFDDVVKTDVILMGIVVVASSVDAGCW